MRGCMKQSWGQHVLWDSWGKVVSMKSVRSVAMGSKMLVWGLSRWQWIRSQEVATSDSVGICLWLIDPFGDLSAGLTCLDFTWIGKVKCGVLESQLRLSCWLGFGLANLCPAHSFMQIISMLTSKPSSLPVSHFSFYSTLVKVFVLSQHGLK